jgi:hypothetical protein
MAPVLVTALLLAVIAVLVLSRARQVQFVTVLKGNSSGQPVEIVLNHFQDTQCGMLLEQVRDTAQAVAPDGRTWFFDDVGCLALWYGDNPHRQEMALWARTRDTDRWLDARAAWYSRTAETAMHYGMAAYEKEQEGFIRFPEMVRLMQRGENLTNPYTRKELLGDR